MGLGKAAPHRMLRNCEMRTFEFAGEGLLAQQSQAVGAPDSLCKARSKRNGLPLNAGAAAAVSVDDPVWSLFG